MKFARYIPIIFVGCFLESSLKAGTTRVRCREMWGPPNGGGIFSMSIVEDSAGRVNLTAQACTRYHFNGCEDPSEFYGPYRVIQNGEHGFTGNEARTREEIDANNQRRYIFDLGDNMMFNFKADSCAF